MKGKLTAPRARVVLYDGPGSQPLDPERRFELLEAMLSAGHSVTVPAAHGSVAPADDTPHVVVGEFNHGAAPRFESLAGEALPIQNLAGVAKQEIAGRLDESCREVGAEPPVGWKPWFPVIDYDRCTNCMQCLTFCLFDVYGVDGEQQIQVQHQDHCKTDCPACSRVCPEAAILFPKYKKSPINGAEVTEDDLKSESMKVDISALLGGDLYSALRTRSKDARERFSTERDESRALLERKRCLKKLGETLDIPNEVLMTLPSVEDIESRAERAREKARLRQQRSLSAQDQKPPPSEDDWGI